MSKKRDRKVIKERIELMICMLEDNVPSFLFNMTKHSTIAEIDSFKKTRNENKKDNKS